MIVVKLMGGLGNQMFQYAAARRLAQVSGVPLKLDLSWFARGADGTTPRDYALAPFNIEAGVAQDEEKEGLLRLPQRLALLAARFPPFRGRYLKERHFHFDAGMLKPRRTAYLDGYWQSERYFSDIAPTISRDFSLKEAPRGLNRNTAADILAAGVASVSLHVRRGDYVNNPEVTSFHGACSLEYYAAAVASLAGKLRDPHFFIFSDDPAWVARNLVPGHSCTIVSHNGPDAAHEDLRLMSLCSHHIIANSTFSWWGAWLCANPGKIVIAPRRWFATEKLDARDLVPASWVRI